MANILTLISATGKNVSEFERDTGISRALIYQVHNGQDCRVSTAVRLAKALGVKPSVLFPELDL